MGWTELDFSTKLIHLGRPFLLASQATPPGPHAKESRATPWRAIPHYDVCCLTVSSALLRRQHTRLPSGSCKAE